MSYVVIHRQTGNAPWAYDNVDEAMACAEDMSEDGDEWAVCWMGPDPKDNEVVAFFPKETE